MQERLATARGGLVNQLRQERLARPGFADEQDRDVVRGGDRQVLEHLLECGRVRFELAGHPFQAAGSERFAWSRRGDHGGHFGSVWQAALDRLGHFGGGHWLAQMDQRGTRRPPFQHLGAGGRGQHDELEVGEAGLKLLDPAVGGMAPVISQTQVEDAQGRLLFGDGAPRLFECGLALERHPVSQDLADLVKELGVRTGGDDGNLVHESVSPSRGRMLWQLIWSL